MIKPEQSNHVVMASSTRNEGTIICVYVLYSIRRLGVVFKRQALSSQYYVIIIYIDHESKFSFLHLFNVV